MVHAGVGSKLVSEGSACGTGQSTLPIGNRDVCRRPPLGQHGGPPQVCKNISQSEVCADVETISGPSSTGHLCDGHGLVAKKAELPGSSEGSGRPLKLMHEIFTMSSAVCIQERVLM